MELCIFVVLVTVGYFWKAKVSFVCYIYATFLAFMFFFIHSILTRPSEEGLSVNDQEGITSSSFFFHFFFLGKNKTKLFLICKVYGTMQPSPFRVFVILHATTFHVEYNFWIENTYGSVRVSISPSAESRKFGFMAHSRGTAETCHILIFDY